MNHDKIIEITPELDRRVQEERRREPREKIASMERRLSDIALIVRSVKKPEDLNLEVLLDLAEGRL